MNLNLFFTPTDILLPAHADMRRWSVIACDQFTADAGYWQAVQDTVGDAPSTLRLMLPEFYLGKCDEAAATREIQQTMRRYLDDGVFRTVPHSLVLVQRTLPGGAVRCGVVGALDLEAYDYAPDSVTPIRATEGTVASRLPARVRIRAAAALEMPHIMVFYSDPEDTIRREAQAAAGETLYDFDLMSGGGHVRGLRIAGAKADALAARLCATGVGTDGAYPMRFAIADGNHSLAAARLCWLEKKQTLTPEQAAADPARYALVELVNLHSPAVTFEPIHRVLFGVDHEKFMKAFQAAYPNASAQVQAYVAANLELESALAYLLEELETAGIADDTVICLAADHYPYLLSDTDTETKTPIVIPDGQLSLDNFPKLAWGDQFATLSVDELPDATINGAPVFVGDDNAILKKGVGKYYGSDFCGEGGKIVLSAHCNKAFYCLEDMQLGYTVRMHTVYGEYAYEVSDIFLFNMDDNHVVLDKTDSEQLLLYTCYPRGLGFRRQRLAVVCKKVSGADFK